MMPSQRFRRPYRQLNDFKCARILGMREVGWSYRAIDRHLQRTDISVQSIYNSFTLLKNLKNKYRLYQNYRDDEFISYAMQGF
ncbi:UNVERIFIED_CONTAM: hypothetical protein NCL1_52061 [Trichonephila clavipes]